MAENSIKYFIVAKNIDYDSNNVYYYKREDLREGERIAEGVNHDKI